MRNHIPIEEIPREIKMQLPIIPAEKYQKRGCRDCGYYAGSVKKGKRCLMKECVLVDEDELFHPVLKKMMTKLLLKSRIKGEQQELAKKRYQTMQSMFRDEIKEEEKKNDVCYACPYGKGRPCIGYCTDQLLKEMRKK